MKKILITVITLVMMVTATACGKGEEKKELNIAYFDNITHGQALVMKHDNSLQKELGDDVKVNWVAFNAGPAEVEACFAGDIDIGYIGPVPAVTANTRSNGDFVIISAATNGGAVLLARKESKVSSVADLAGKKVAIPQVGNTQHLLLLDLLTANGLSPASEGGDVEVVESANADIANLMNSSAVDAALVPEPWGSTIVSNTESELVLDYDEINDGEAYSTAVVIVNKEFMEENKDVVKTFLEQHINATEYICQYPEEAAVKMNEQLDADTGKKLDDTIILEAIKKIEYVNEIPKDSVLNYAKISEEQEFIEKQPEEDVFSSSLLDELTK